MRSQSPLAIDFGMLATPSITALLVNLKYTTPKPKIKKAVHYCTHTSKVTTDFSTELCIIWDVAQPIYKFHREHFF